MRTEWRERESRTVQAPFLAFMRSCNSLKIYEYGNNIKRLPESRKPERIFLILIQFTFYVYGTVFLYSNTVHRTMYDGFSKVKANGLFYIPAESSLLRRRNTRI